MPGTLHFGQQAPTGLRLTEHIFVGEKGDYYELSDGLLQKPGH